MPRRNRLVGVFIGEFVEREPAGLGDLERAPNRIFMATEQPCHLGRRFDVTFAVGFEQEAGLVDCGLLADAGQHILQGPARRCMVENIIGRNQRHMTTLCQSRQRTDARLIIAAIKMRGGKIERRHSEGRSSGDAGLPQSAPPHTSATFDPFRLRHRPHICIERDDRCLIRLACFLGLWCRPQGLVPIPIRRLPAR